MQHRGIHLIESKPPLAHFPETRAIVLRRRTMIPLLLSTVTFRQDCNAEPEESDLVKDLLQKTRDNKEKNDQDRLDRYYHREWVINNWMGQEILPEPCDPRDIEMGYRCRMQSLRNTREERRH